MNSYEIKDVCEKWKDNPEAYQKCLPRNAQYSSVER
jgi:hypothetical protein